MPDDITTLKTQMNKMRSELDDIKKRMVDREEGMTQQEFKEYKKSFNKNNLVSAKEAKKHLMLK